MFRRKKSISLHEKKDYAMTKADLRNTLEELLRMPAETEVVEFKKARNGFGDQELGEYFSALSNEANLREKECAWLVFGVENDTHVVLGSNYKNTPESLDAVKKTIADQTTDRITFREIYSLEYEGKRVVMFEIAPAPQGIPVAYQGHYYGRDGESLVALNIQKIEQIRGQRGNRDWSAGIVSGADIGDLDPDAIAKARGLYAAAHPDLADDIAEWSDETFLNKAKITIKGRITNAAIVLLGKEESECLISPAVAKIKWILKDADNNERDYMIVPCPFVLAVDRVYDKIRNLKYRYINTELKTLFPEEIDTYEPYVIREAINNAIAHQDYTKGGQINVVEYGDRLVFSNKGSFIPGCIENVLENDAPEESYRNQFLVTAMVGLRMVDTIGSGIRKMYTYQRNRLFPLPDYDITEDRVTVTIFGKILDMDYANMLARNTELSLMDIELLNRVQLKKPLSDMEVRRLRGKKLIEGRRPNLIIAKDIAGKTGQSVPYSEHKGLNDKACEELLLASLRDHGVLSREDIRTLLWNALPDMLNDGQKQNKIKNMLARMKRQGKISNVSNGPNSEWRIADK